MYSERDHAALMQTLFDDGRQEGLAEGRQEGLAEGKREGMEEGSRKGQQKERQEVALRMLSDGMPEELVCRYSGLSADAVAELAGKDR